VLAKNERANGLSLSNGMFELVPPSSPPRFNILRREENLSQAHLRLSRVWIEHLDWQTCLRKYDRDYTLHFMDPPYWETEGYGVPFPLEEYHKIAEAMRTMKGSAILTINDHPRCVSLQGIPDGDSGNQPHHRWSRERSKQAGIDL